MSGRVFAKATRSDETAVSAPSERRPDEPSASRIVRASGGSAGAFAGRSADEQDIAEVQPGQHEPGNERALVQVADAAPSWSASTISTSDGGMICASVPDAAITPLASRRS